MKNITEAITDYFVICHGDSTPQTRAIIDHLEEEVKKQANIRPLHIEGRSNGEWCLIDFGDIVVHVFLREKREFYQLEELWSDAVITRYDD
jgi:ribosome-associated protein